MARGKREVFVALTKVSWSILLICAMEFMFWTDPLSVAVSADNSKVGAAERASIDAYYHGNNANFARTDRSDFLLQKRQLLEENVEEVGDAERQFNAEHVDENSGHVSRAALSGVLASSAFALMYAMGGGESAKSSSGKGASGGEAASEGDSERRKKNAQQNNHSRQLKQQQPATTTSSVDNNSSPTFTASSALSTPIVALAALGAAGAFLLRKRSVNFPRHYNSSPPRAVLTRNYAATPLASGTVPSKIIPPVTGQVPTMDLPRLLGNLTPPPLRPTENIAISVAAKPSVTPAESFLRERSDDDIAALVRSGKVAQHNLEKELGDMARAVRVRRLALMDAMPSRDALQALPHENYDYTQVVGVCCENVLGYVPIPVGVVGPVLLDGKLIHIPMATTEGCLIASTHRGAKAISESGGAHSVLMRDGITRAPVVRLPSVVEAGKLISWMRDPVNSEKIKEAFNSTSRFARLQEVEPRLAGRQVYLRFRCATGDAMGMNMISKACEKALDVLQKEFPVMQLVALSGNLCTDKKPSAVNWLEGRGKSVACEATIKGDIVRKVLKTTVKDLVELNISKNLVGSAMAGSIGGFNAHAANIVTAIFLATGQDPAQNVESSNCITLMEATGENGEDLHISVTMPSIEVGTVGGGTQLPGQSACLQMMGLKGSHPSTPGKNAQELARAIACATMAGELSLMSALAAGHLVKSHMQHNRRK